MEKMDSWLRDFLTEKMHWYKMQATRYLMMFNDLSHSEKINFIPLLINFPENSDERLKDICLEFFQKLSEYHSSQMFELKARLNKFENDLDDDDK
jgi:hypothetical protein